MTAAPKTKQPAPRPSRIADQGPSIRPGKIVHYTIGSEPMFFPPKSDFPNGGRFHVRVATGTVLLRTDVGGPTWPLDAGATHDITIDQPDELLLSGDGAVIRVMQQKV